MASIESRLAKLEKTAATIAVGRCDTCGGALGRQCVTMDRVFTSAAHGEFLIDNTPTCEDCGGGRRWLDGTPVGERRATPIPGATIQLEMDSARELLDACAGRAVQCGDAAAESRLRSELLALDDAALELSETAAKLARPWCGTAPPSGWSLHG